MVDQGTGQKVKHQFGIVADIAGKTGTTQNNTDGWFILMHPRLVAGAWVGFNDQRITMRSSYWGQGGHNAILVVGDFFRDTLKQRRIDIKVRFPRPPRIPLMVENDADDRDALAQVEHHNDGTASDDQPAPGHGIIVRKSGNRILVGDARGMQILEQDEKPSTRTSEELARVMTDRGSQSVGGGDGFGSAGAD